jgi:hypothetical protein
MTVLSDQKIISGKRKIQNENTLSFTSSSLDGHVSLLCIRATPRSTDRVLIGCLYDLRGIED